MAEQVKPTRMELIRKREQIRLAEQGRDLLREKMDALVREFFRVMNDGLGLARGARAGLASADRALLIAQAVDDPVALKSASFATKRQVMLEIEGRSIMGVPIPVIEKNGSFEPDHRSSGGTASSAPAAVSTRWPRRFEAELDLIIGLAETETTLRRIGHEIQMTRRRVNALEQVMIPELYRQTKYIKITIEEREREDLFRLKKVKRLLEAAEEAVPGRMRRRRARPSVRGSAAPRPCSAPGRRDRRPTTAGCSAACEHRRNSGCGTRSGPRWNSRSRSRPASRSRLRCRPRCDRVRSIAPQVRPDLLECRSRRSSPW